MSISTPSRDLLDLAAALIREPTPNPPGEERAAAQLLATWLRDCGVDAQLLPLGDPDSPRANVFARVPGRGDAPPLVLCGHLDTVPAGEGAWHRDPLSPAVEDDRLYGLGAADMKGAVAAMAVAAVRLAAESTERPLAGDLLLAFTSGEETGSYGAAAFARSGLLDRAAGIVIGEPTGNRVAIAEKGGLWVDLIVHGRTTHGSLPHLGANAAAGLVAILATLEAAALPHDAPTPASSESPSSPLSLPPHPLLGAPTLAVTRLAGGVANNVVPDRASAVLDVRTLPGQSPDAIRAAILHLAETVAAPRGLRVTLDDLGSRVALDVPEDHPLVAATRGAVQDVLGQPPEICGLTGATDATELVPPLGLPFVICGPGQMAQAHQPDEFVALPALAAAEHIYYRLARRLLA